MDNIKSFFIPLDQDEQAEDMLQEAFPPTWVDIHTHSEQ